MAENHTARPTATRRSVLIGAAWAAPAIAVAASAPAFAVGSGGVTVSAIQPNPSAAPSRWTVTAAFSGSIPAGSAALDFYPGSNPGTAFIVDTVTLDPTSALVVTPVEDTSRTVGGVHPVTSVTLTSSGFSGTVTLTLGVRVLNSAGDSTLTLAGFNSLVGVRTTGFVIAP